MRAVYILLTAICCLSLLIYGTAEEIKTIANAQLLVMTEINTNMLKEETTDFTNVSVLQTEISRHVHESIATNTKIERMIEDLNPEINDSVKRHIAKSVITSAKKYNLDSELVVSLIMQESTFDTKAKSPVGCLGLMQVSPNAHADKLKNRNLSKKDLFTISHNIDIGCEILREYIDDEKSLPNALKKYGGYKHKNNKYVKNVIKTYKKYRVV